MTSFAFMFELVPEPVWKTSIGNWSSNSPAAIRSPAAAMRCARSASRRPRSAFARAAAALMRPSQCATATGIGSPETGKFATAFVVSPPQSSCRSSVALTGRSYPPRSRRALLRDRWADRCQTPSVSSRRFATVSNGDVAVVASRDCACARACGAIGAHPARFPLDGERCLAPFGVKAARCAGLTPPRAARPTSPA